MFVRPSHVKRLNVINVLQRAQYTNLGYENVELTPRTHNPLVHSFAIASYFHYRVQHIILRDFVNSGTYNSHLANRDYMVQEGNKITGYVINGYFFDFSQIYEIGFQGVD